MTDRPAPPRDDRPPWWPKEASWQGRGSARLRLAVPQPAVPPPVPPPPEPPAFINRAAGLLLLAATLGLASCQAFLTAASMGMP